MLVSFANDIRTLVGTRISALKRLDEEDKRGSSVNHQGRPFPRRIRSCTALYDLIDGWT